MKEDVKMNLKKIICFVICFIFMSSFCLLPVYADYDDYDLGDYDYTPVALPDPTQYPCTADGFTSFTRDLTLYLAVSPYDAVCDYLTDTTLPGNALNYFSKSDEDIKNPAEVFRRMLFPTPAFSPYYDPYYENEWHSHGHPGSHGRETYSFGDGLLTFTYDFNLSGAISLGLHSNVSDLNNSSSYYDDVLCSLVVTANYSDKSGGSAFWRSSMGMNFPDYKNFHYSGTVSNPHISLRENKDKGLLLCSVLFDYKLVRYNTDTGESSTIVHEDASAGSPLAVCKLSDPNYVDIKNKLKGVPTLIKEPDTPPTVDNAPQCVLIPEPKEDSAPPVTDVTNTPFFFYVDVDGDINISPDIVLDTTPPTVPDVSYPVTSDGTVNINGNNFMCLPVLNSFSLNMQNLFNVSLSCYYQNLYINMGGDASECGCPDYSSWLSLINSRLVGIDYDLNRIYSLLLCIYNKQADQFDFSADKLPGVDFPELKGEVSVAIDDLELTIYRKFDYSNYFTCLRNILDYFVDGYAEVDKNNYYKMFNVSDPPDPFADSPGDPALPGEDSGEVPEVAASDSVFYEFSQTGTVSPSFCFEFMGQSIDLMSWYTPEVEPYMAILRNFIGLCLLCGWLLWFVRSLPSLFNVVGSVDNGKGVD